MISAWVDVYEESGTHKIHNHQWQEHRKRHPDIHSHTQELRPPETSKEESGENQAFGLAQT